MTDDAIAKALSWALAITGYGLAGALAVAVGVCCWVQVWN